MKDRVTLLGIGLRRKFWVHFVQRLAKYLSRTNLTLEPKAIGKIFFDFEKRCVSKIREFRPDVIVFGETISELWQNDFLLDSIRSKNGYLPSPLLFIAAPNAINTFAEFLKKKHVSRVVISNLGIVDLFSIDHFATDPNFKALYHSIDPAPEFFFRGLPANSFTHKLIDRKNISAVFWKSSRFDADDFFNLQIDYLNMAEPPQTPAPTIYLRGDQAVFVNGVCLSSIVQFHLHGISFEQIIDQETILSNRKLFDSFCQKFCQLIYSRQNSTYLAQMESDPEAIKRNTPIQVCSFHQSVRKIFAFLLMEDGFHRILSNQCNPKYDPFLLDLHQGDDTIMRQGRKSYFIPFLEQIGSEWDFKALDQYASLHAIDPTKMVPIDNVNCEKSILRKKIQNLKFKKKVSHSSKVLNYQERYQNFIALRKLDILTGILERAIIWDEKKNESTTFDEDNALIFYDDALQGSLINKQLPGIRKKKLFINISKKLNGLRKIAAINTDIIESFLYSGLVVCSVTSKIILSRNFRLYRHQLDQESKRSPSEEEMQLNERLTKLTQKLTELSFIRLYQASENIYRKHKNLILESIKNLCKEKPYGKIRTDFIQKVTIATKEKKTGNMIGAAIKNIFKENYRKKIEVTLAWSDLKLKTKHEDEKESQFTETTEDSEERQKRLHQDFACQNIAILSTFFNRIICQIKNFESDLLIFEYEAELIGVLVRMIRQELPRFELIPIIAIITDESTEENLNELLKLGVRMISADCYKMQDTEAIRKTIEFHLP